MVLPNELSKNVQDISKEEIMSKKIKTAIFKVKQEGKSSIFVSQMYSKSLTVRRSVASKYRADLKEPIPSIQGYVKFPAMIMIKRVGESKYSLEKEFFELQIF